MPASQWLGIAVTVLWALPLLWWRRRPRAVLAVGTTLTVLVCAAMTWRGVEPAVHSLALLVCYMALAGYTFRGRAAWYAGAGALAALFVLYAADGDWSSPGTAILTLPGFFAGTALRLRQETAEALALRAEELDHERELFARVCVRNERARIAAELHDIVGHAVSVMVVQAAAGQRLAERAPERARASLDAIAESARQGRADLHRLVDLLGGSEIESPDLSLVDEVVSRAASSGLQVTCRFEGDRDGVDARRAHVAFRVVQESLTNALRHAPGSVVRVLVRGEPGGRTLTVRVENEPPPAVAAQDRPAPRFTGGGRGLQGLRERVQELGGSFAAGPLPAGGWHVEARF